jgi:hypothetical protein
MRVVRIFETVFDADGVMVSRQALGVIFLHRGTAARFLEIHLPSAFVGGKTGYECAGDYWWGRSGQPGAVVHHYTIEG